MNPAMLSKTRTLWIVIFIVVALCLSSCNRLSPLTETSVAYIGTPSPQGLKTTIGDFLITSVRLVDEVHADKAQPGEKFLLVGLTQPGSERLVPGDFSLESFQNMIHDSNGQIYVLGDDDVPVISTMAGWIQDEFVMGFRVPIADSYTLYWPGNSPLELSPKGQ
jgi:hypothetical protein